MSEKQQASELEQLEPLPGSPEEPETTGKCMTSAGPEPSSGPSNGSPPSWEESISTPRSGAKPVPSSEWLPRGASLPPRECPDCGELMDEGVLVLGVPYYPHLKSCLALEARLLDEDLAFREESRRRWRVLRAALPPPGPDTVGEMTHHYLVYQKGHPLGRNEQAYRVAWGFFQVCNMGELPPDGFTLQGGKGVGKTTLMEALARSLLAHTRWHLRWESAPELYLHLLKHREDLEAHLQRLCHFDVLFLDDLGREKPTPWWVDQVLFPLVRERTRLGKPLVVTTNYSWAELAQRYSEAKNDREQAASGEVLVDRLQQRAAAARFYGESHRRPGWSFLREEAPLQDELELAAGPEEGSAGEEGL